MVLILWPGAEGLCISSGQPAWPCRTALMQVPESWIWCPAGWTSSCSVRHACQLHRDSRCWPSVVGASQHLAAGTACTDSVMPGSPLSVEATPCRASRGLPVLGNAEPPVLMGAPTALPARTAVVRSCCRRYSLFQESCWHCAVRSPPCKTARNLIVQQHALWGISMHCGEQLGRTE